MSLFSDRWKWKTRAPPCCHGDVAAEESPSSASSAGFSLSDQPARYRQYLDSFITKALILKCGDIFSFFFFSFFFASYID